MNSPSHESTVDSSNRMRPDRAERIANRPSRTRSPSCEFSLAGARMQRRSKMPLRQHSCTTNTEAEFQLSDNHRPPPIYHQLLGITIDRILSFNEHTQDGKHHTLAAIPSTIARLHSAPKSIHAISAHHSFASTFGPSQSPTCSMQAAQQSQGIQTLLEAEKEAAKIVQKARTCK